MDRLSKLCEMTHIPFNTARSRSDRLNDEWLGVCDNEGTVDECKSAYSRYRRALALTAFIRALTPRITRKLDGTSRLF